MESVVGITSYLESRRFNRKTLDNIGKAISPCIVEFNESNPEDKIDVNWSMSAKHQSGTIMVEMDSGNHITPVVEEFILNTLSEELEEWFDCGFDEEDISDTYASAMVGF